LAAQLRYTQPLRNFLHPALSEPTMRACLSLLLMLMLVLRGLMGDAMAMGMVAPVMPAAMAEHHTSSMVEHADLDSSHGVAASSHCDTAKPNAQSGDHSQHDTAQHGASCSACGLCHSAVDLFRGAGFAALPAPSLARASGSAPFASALLAQASKPPIS
jgi:hypothetical protein